MLNTKPVEVQLQVIIDENGLNSAIATLANAIEGVIASKEIEHNQAHPDESYEDTEEYKNLVLAEAVIDRVMDAFDIDEAKATREDRIALVKHLRWLLTASIDLNRHEITPRHIEGNER